MTQWGRVGNGAGEVRRAPTGLSMSASEDQRTEDFDLI